MDAVFHLFRPRDHSGVSALLVKLGRKVASLELISCLESSLDMLGLIPRSIDNMDWRGGLPAGESIRRILNNSAA